MTSREFTERVHRCAKRADVHVGGELLGGLEGYYRLLESWNEKINLTALDLSAESDRAINRLLIEPLVAMRYLPVEAGQIIDIGSGGGSPGIPMQLARKDLSFTLVEAKTRKSAFLREACRRLGVDVSVETCRFETLLSRPDMHEAFAGVTLRAVRVEPRVLRGLQAFLRPGGRVLLFRGPGAAGLDVGITPPLFWEGSSALVESLQSRLVVLGKMSLGLPAVLPPAG
jgi:16S rRNA (guanine527-N7)-methyltransferase